MMIHQKRYYSSGIRSILRALVNIKNKEEANVGNKLFKAITPKVPTSETATEVVPSPTPEQPSGLENLPMVIRAELERRVPKPPKRVSEPLPPVVALKTRKSWACMKGCGACCFLEKGPQYPPVEDVLKDPKDVALYKSMIGKDGWCKNFDKSSRLCTIFNDRPRFCRVEPEILEELFGIPERKVDKEVCSLCRDSISEIYGCKSKEMKNFERLIAGLKAKG